MVSSHAREALWCTCPESANASQMLVSQSSIVVSGPPLGLLVEQGRGNTLRRHFLFAGSRATAMHQGKLHAPRRWDWSPAVRLGQTGSEQFGHDIFHLAALLRRADLDSAHQFIRQVERGLHLPSILFLCFYGRATSGPRFRSEPVLRCANPGRPRWVR
ncbi:Uncharacterised protein [Mycobacterium tuberculosis]|nr:Uncharacterised protein [Mycobacterium tuberculosis]